MNTITIQFISEVPLKLRMMNLSHKRLANMKLTTYVFLEYGLPKFKSLLQLFDNLRKIYVFTRVNPHSSFHLNSMHHDVF